MESYDECGSCNCRVYRCVVLATPMLWAVMLPCNTNFQNMVSLVVPFLENQYIKTSQENSFVLVCKVFQDQVLLNEFSPHECPTRQLKVVRNIVQFLLCESVHCRASVVPCLHPFKLVASFTVPSPSHVPTANIQSSIMQLLKAQALEPD